MKTKKTMTQSTTIKIRYPKDFIFARLSKLHRRALAQPTGGGAALLLSGPQARYTCSSGRSISATIPSLLQLILSLATFD
jgi:hypothetical protein